jgi:phosphate transport system substrate-binding protein
MIRRIGTPSPALLLLLAGATLVLSGCRQRESGGQSDVATIQNKGSDTMVNIAQAWAEEYKAVRPEVAIEVSGGGSGQGIAALIKGAVDMANCSRNMKGEEIDLARRNTGKEPVEFIVGFDALAIFVHASNPLEEITFEQLYEIYAEKGEVTRWSDMGVKIPGGKSDKIVRVSRQSSSGTYEFFREKVMHKHDFKLGSLDMNGSKEVVEVVASAPTAIGYSGMGYARSGVKMLRVSPGPGKSPVYPTVETTVNHAYPISRSLLIYTLGSPQGPLKDYLDWILSSPGQKLVQENGYVPVSAEPSS